MILQKNENQDGLLVSFEYYYRRKNKYFFRYLDKKISFVSHVDLDIKRGERYNFFYQLTEN